MDVAVVVLRQVLDGVDNNEERAVSDRQRQMSGGVPSTVQRGPMEWANRI